jgi:hypothetical protein
VGVFKGDLIFETGTDGVEDLEGPTLANITWFEEEEKDEEEDEEEGEAEEEEIMEGRSIEGVNDEDGED